jgi:hypothetical protein
MDLCSPNLLFFQLAQHFDDRQTGHLDRLASRCVPPILALEIETVGRHQ